LSLAKEAFDGKVNEALTIMDLGSQVSRKNDYIPCVTNAIKKGWAKPRIQRDSIAKLDLGELFVDPMDPYQRVRRRGSVLVPTAGQHFDVTHEFVTD
jgi:hypothetical protein